MPPPIPTYPSTLLPSPQASKLFSSLSFMTKTNPRQTMETVVLVLQLRNLQRKLRSPAASRLTQFTAERVEKELQRRAEEARAGVN